MVCQETHQKGITFLNVGEKHSRRWATMTTANEQKRQTCGTVEWRQPEIRWRWSGTSRCPRCLTPDGPGASLPICDPYEKLHDGPNPDHLNVSRRSISCMNGIVLHSCPWRLNDLLSQKNALKTGTLVEPGTTHDMAVNHQPQPQLVCLSRWSAQHERCLPGDCVLAIGDVLMDSKDRITSE